MAPPQPEPSPIVSFPEHFRQAFQGLRGALSDVLTAVGADPTRSRELARLLAVNKNLAWRVSKVVTARDAFAVVHHVPGPAAMTQLLAALRKQGAPEVALGRVREALAAYDEMVGLHTTGDRGSLEQMAAGLTRDPSMGERMEQSRKQAFTGLGATWGVQAEMQMGTFLVAPSATEPGALDLVTIGGMVGFRRLRGDGRWLLFRRKLRSDTGSNLLRPTGEPLDPDVPTDGLPLLADFCSSPLPEFESQQLGEQLQCVLPAGPIGDTAAFTSLFGLIHRAVLPARRTETEQHAEFTFTMSTPSKRVQVDLIVSEELDWALDPKLSLYSRLNGGEFSEAAGRENDRLSLFEDIQDLGRGPATMASPHVPRYTELLQMAFERAGWDGETFRGFRFSMRYPAIPTRVMLSADLPG